jgi:hypothetical protein
MSEKINGRSFSRQVNSCLGLTYVVQSFRASSKDLPEVIDDRVATCLTLIVSQTIHSKLAQLPE